MTIQEMSGEQIEAQMVKAATSLAIARDAGLTVLVGVCRRTLARYAAELERRA